jgi:hypothetical protein
MSATLTARIARSQRRGLRVCRGPEPDAPVPLWRINGYRARLLIWTPDEWEKMDAPPPDAQYHPSGVWCALRMD